MLVKIGLLVLLSVVSFSSHAAGTGGGGDSINRIPGEPRTPEQMADHDYQVGLNHKARAWRLEERAAKAKSDAKREKLLERAQREYVKARDRQASALRLLPTHYEAANELGYALRKTGDYENAIGAYNYALKLEPDFLPAIEYRGEALLVLGFFDETRDAYMRLFREDQTLAAQLMAAIDRWRAEHAANGTEARAFVRWAEERKRLANFGRASAQNW